MENRNKGAFTLIELLLGVSLISLIYLGATTAQVAGEAFLISLREKFQRHLEIANTMDHIVQNIRRSYDLGLPAANLLNLRQESLGKLISITYRQVGSNIVYFRGGGAGEVLAKEATLNFEGLGRAVRIRITTISEDPAKEAPMVLISQGFLRDSSAVP